MSGFIQGDIQLGNTMILLILFHLLRKYLCSLRCTVNIIILRPFTLWATPDQHYLAKTWLFSNSTAIALSCSQAVRKFLKFIWHEVLCRNCSIALECTSAGSYITYFGSVCKSIFISISEQSKQNYLLKQHYYFFFR